MNIDWPALFGYDIFISYKRGDGIGGCTKYANQLRVALAKEGLQCFFDEDDAPAGALLSETVARGIRKSRALVVLCTPTAIVSPFVQKEVALFAERNRMNILPINFDNCLERMEDPGWPMSVLTEVAERIWIQERSGDEPSSETIRAILTTFKSRRARSNRINFLTAAMVVLAVISCVAILQSFAANRSRSEALRSAQAERVQRVLAEEQRRLAEQKTREANEQKKVADQRTVEAQVAERRAQENEQAAEKATRVAVEQRDLAQSREFAAKGEEALGRDRAEALRYGALAMERAKTIEAESIVARSRASLVCRLPQQKSAAGVALSPDGGMVAAVDGGERLVLVSTVNCGVERRVRCAGCRLTSVAYSKDGRWLLTVDGDSELEVWDAGQGTQMLAVNAVSNKIAQARISGDGAFVSVLTQGRTEIWSVTEKRRVLSLEASVVAFSPRGTKAIVVANARSSQTRGDAQGDAVRMAGVFVLELPSGRQVAKLDGIHGYISDFVFAQDGTLVCPITTDRDTGVWEVESGRMRSRLSGHTREQWAAAFSPDGKMVATGSMDQTMRLWSGADGRSIATFGPFASLAAYHGVEQVSFTRNGRKVLGRVKGENVVRIWNVESRREVVHFDLGAEKVARIDLDPEGTRALVVEEDGNSALWGLGEEGWTAQRFGGHSEEINSVALSPDERYLVSASEDGTAQIWDLSTGERAGRIEVGRGLFGAMFSPDGRSLVMRDEEGVTKLWDWKTGTVRVALEAGGVAQAFSPDGRHLLGTDVGSRGGKDGGRDVVLWDVATGKRVIAVRGLKDVNEVRFSPEAGEVLAAGLHRALLWRVGKGDAGFGVGAWPAPVELEGGWASFSADGRKVVTHTEGKILIWDAGSGQRVASFSTRSGRVASAVFSPDGREVVVVGEHGEVAFYDARTGEFVRVVGSSDQGAEWAMLSGDGRREVGSGSQGIRVWEARSGRLVTTIEASERMLILKCVSADGRMIATIVPAGIEVYRQLKAEELRRSLSAGL